MTNLVGRVQAALRDAGVTRGSRVLVAVSGGPDSTALLRAACSASRRGGFTVHACTIDHGIRGREESAADVRFVEELCRALGVELSVRRIPSGECARRVRERHASLEEAARDMRHALLRAVAEEEGATIIALGHTEDDDIETLLMRVLSGADVEGLRGIAPRRGPFLRPLLRCSRAEVIAYLRSLGQPWREDATNADTSFLRNRVRRDLVPLLESEFPGFKAGLRALSRKASIAADLVRRAAAGLRWSTDGDGVSVSLADFRAAHPAARSAALLRMYDRVKPSGAPRRLPARFLACVSDGRPLADESCLARGHGMALRTVAGRLWWGPDIARRGKKGYFIEVFATGDVAIRGAGLRLRVQRGSEAVAAVAGDVSLQACDVKPPLVLRSRRSGDVIALPGGVESVSDLMAGGKIPAPERDNVPILADRDGVLAVLGGALGYRNRARAGALGGSTGEADRVFIHIDHDMEEGREQQ